MIKKLLGFIVCVSIILSSFAVNVTAKDSESIVILYENDVHCAVEGYSKLAAMKNDLKTEYEYVGVVSSGDFVQGGTLGAASKGEYIVKLMNIVGYDAIGLGNHEFDYCISRLLELYELSETKYISCNFAKIGEEKTYFEPYRIVSYGDVDIAYIGIVTPETITSARPSQFRDENDELIYTFNETRLSEVVQETIDEAKKDGADYVIALSHIGYDESGNLSDVTDIIENTDGLDVVLDAHSHSVIEKKTIKDKSGDDVLLTSTGTGFKNIGKLTITNGTFDTELIPTEGYTKTHADVDSYIEEIKESYAEIGNRKIGESKVDLITNDENGNRLVRRAETNLGNFCSDALRIIMDADVSFVNGGGMRTPIKVGDVTFNDLLSVYPFNNRIVTAEITGQILLDMLEMAMMPYPEECGAFPHMSGMTFSVDKSIASSVKVDDQGFFVSVDGDYRVYDVKVLNKQSGLYEKLELDKKYVITASDYYILDLGGGLSMFKNATVLQNEGVLDVDIMEMYITDNLNGVIGEEYKDVDHRITFTEGKIESTPENTSDLTAEYATREYIISEFVQSVGRNQLNKSDAILEIFADSENISPEYREDISRAIIGGIVKGYDDRTIRPTEPVTRIEAMVMLARCIPELDASGEAIEFTDVPDWARKEIEYLSKAGLVKGYGDGTLGANDFITVEQVKILVGRSDAAFSTVAPGESFYGYVNEKSFRNAILENKNAIDPIHGAVVTRADAWSVFSDVYDEIVRDETEILEKIVNNEIPIENGSAEQRVRDMLECIDSNIAVTDTDKKNISDMRNAIVNAKNIDEFLKITGDIYKQAGINVLFDIYVEPDANTGVPYPIFSIASAGHGGLFAFRSKTDTEEYKNVYASLISRYLAEIGVEFDEKEIDKAIKLQIESAKDVDYFYDIVSYFSFAYMFDIMTEEEIEAEVKEMVKRNPDFFNENGEHIGNDKMYLSKDKDAADLAYDGFDVCEELTDYGFTNLEKIIIPIKKITSIEEDIISEKNLNALKINALLMLEQNLGVALSSGESLASSLLDTLPLVLCLTSSADELKEAMESEAEDAENEMFKETTGIEYDEGILSAVNLDHFRHLLPNDIGLVYTKYYYDDETSEVIANMIQEIADAYAERFKNNPWMDESTKANALKKLDNMVAVIGYPDNYNFPTIVPMSEGGSLFSNTLNIKRQELADLIRLNEDKNFTRTLMLMPPDTVNAGYIPSFNSINIPAGFLNVPIYDKNASYASNLGSIGMVLAHEIGHAFDKSGAMYDENGCIKNWWTEKDYEEFKKIQDEFVEYYNKFEVVDGVVQDASITIGENMADFAALQILTDIIGDDKEALKECFESYARMWAQLGTVSYLTDSNILSDVHSSNVVRVNAVIASLDAFYEIYGIEEGDLMYIAPEERLRLW